MTCVNKFFFCEEKISKIHYQTQTEEEKIRFIGRREKKIRERFFAAKWGPNIGIFAKNICLRKEIKKSFLFRLEQKEKRSLRNCWFFFLETLWRYFIADTVLLCLRNQKREIDFSTICLLLKSFQFWWISHPIIKQPQIE